MGIAMLVIDRFILLVRDLRRSERGIAVPTALMALVASFAFGSVAVMSTVSVQQGTKRDRDSKQAIAAADAGANIAMLRLNRFLPSLTPANPCVGPNGEPQAPSAGWCPSTPAAPVGSALYSYRVSAFTGTGNLTVVSVGTSGTVSRRVAVSFYSVNGKNVFADEKLIGQDSINLEGSSVDIRTDIGTNGDIFTSGHPVICGHGRHGIGKQGPTPDCNGEELEGHKNLPAVTPPADIVNVNSNCRLARTCSDGSFDPISKQNGLTWTGSRILGVGGQATLTMGGSAPYFVCGLFINAGKIIMPVGSNVQIFVDTPQNCGLPSGAVQVEIKGNANIESTAYNPQQGLFEVPGIFLLGNGKVNLAGTSGTNEMMLYAPESEIDMGGNATWKGMIAGRTLRLHGSPKVESDPNMKEPEIALAGLLQRTRYVECTSGSASPPDANC
jgi:hypothetical protein